jgi:glycosyltransferase involved in cell wall biosynthesis
VSYAIVSPVKDEASHLALTAASIRSQTRRPDRWVIVDDGSSDGTRELAETLAREEPWIIAIDSGAGGDRSRGGRVVRAFERGCADLPGGHEFVTKLDGDVELPPDYFERVADTFERDRRAGIVGGRVLVPEGAGWVPDRVGRHTVHGAIKSYRTACLADIGGLRPSMGWDGIDEYAAKARGWKVIPLDGIEVRHHRKRGSKQRWWHARLEEGRGVHYMGYRPSFVVVRAGYRMLVEKPPLLGGAALFAGWLHAAAKRRPVVDDPLAVAALRAEQRARLRGRRVKPDRPALTPPAAR